MAQHSTVLRASTPERRHAKWGWIFISPWLLGFLLFTAWPMIASLYLSFCKYDLNTIQWVGVANYERIFSRDKEFWIALWNTAFYVLFSVPLGLTGSLLLAMVMNRAVRGVSFFRASFYVATLVPSVAASLLWMELFNKDAGPINHVLGWVGVDPIPWLTSKEWAKPSLILMSLWGIGGARMLIFLAGLQQIDQQYYEAADLDGASAWHKFRHITLPLLTPTILFNLILGMIGAFTVFTSAYVMTSGGPENATLFYMLYLFRQAFEYFRMGYASALAWILFAILFGLTLIQFRISKRWVHYEGGE